MSKKQKITLAREFRKNPTRSEDVLWEGLRDRKFINLKFRRQHVILGYIVDFYCVEHKLAIEVDGEIHKYQREDDKRRQKIIEGEGIRFVRVSDKEVENNIQSVLRKIKLAATANE